MNITEEDVRSELDRHKGLEFELEDYSDNWSKIKSKTHGLSITFFYRLPKETVHFECSLDGIQTGTYSAEQIINHIILTPDFWTLYTNSWWTETCELCRSIVRRITGEKQPEKTLYEQVREILEPLPGINGIEVSPTVITFSSGMAKREIVSTGVIDHDPLTDSCKHREFDTYDPEYREAYKAAAALLTPVSTPEKSLEEKVRGWIDDEETFIGDKITVEPHQVVIQVGTDRTITITKGSVHDNETNRIEGLTNSAWDNTVQVLFRKIAAELKTHQPTPTYTELEQRVRELEKENKQLNFANACLAEKVDEIQESCKQIAETKSQILENYNQLASVDGQKTDRITELEAQLQDYVSPADHEAEVKKCNELLAYESKLHMEQRRIACQYRQWFETEYAKNAGVSQ